MKSPALLSRLLPIIILCAPLRCPAWAGDHYIIDRDRTHITFSVSNLGISDITGVFTAYDGDIIFNADHPETGRVSITLYAGAIHATSGEADDDLPKAPTFSMPNNSRKSSFGAQESTLSTPMMRGSLAI